MKFKEEDKLFYINPFVFTIEKVEIQMGILEEVEGEKKIFYIDDSGAYLAEENLFKDLEDAKEYALDLLDLFYQKRKLEIIEGELYNGND